MNKRVTSHGLYVIRFCYVIHVEISRLMWCLHWYQRSSTWGLFLWRNLMYPTDSEARQRIGDNNWSSRALLSDSHSSVDRHHCWVASALQPTKQAWTKGSKWKIYWYREPPASSLAFFLHHLHCLFGYSSYACSVGTCIAASFTFHNWTVIDSQGSRHLQSTEWCS